jgi:hypothetical protein
MTRGVGEGKAKENSVMMSCVDRVVENVAKQYIIMIIQNS